MQMETLRLFCDVAVTQSFTDAARLHHCTPAHASQSFHAVEDEFNLPLAERFLRRIQLNPAGHVCYERCRQIVGLEDELMDKLGQLKKGSGTLEIAVCPSIALYRLPPLLRDFQRTFHGITVNVRQASRDGVHQAVRNNDVDAGLVPYPRRAPGLAVGIFRRVPLVLACHPEHPLAALPMATARQLKNHSIIVWSQISWRPLLRGVRANERHFFEPRHEFNDVEPAIEAVMADIGVAVLPASLVRDEAAQRRLVAVPFEHGRHIVPVAAIHRKRRKLPPALQHFLQFLQLPEPGEKV